MRLQMSNKSIKDEAYILYALKIDNNYQDFH